MRLIRFFFMLCCAFSLLPLYAKSSIQVDNTNIYAKTPFSVTIKSSSAGALTKDVLEKIRKQFTIVGQSSGQMFQSINGKASQQYQWVLSLIPKLSPQKNQVMILSIPALRIGPDLTKSIALRLHPTAKKVTLDLDDSLFFKATISPQSGYEGQQYLLTLSLYRTPGIIPKMQQMSISPFDIKNTRIKPLQAKIPYTARIKGQLYQVLTERFVIYPEGKGEIKIPPVIFSADVIQNKANRSPGKLFSSVFANPFSAVVKTVRIASEPIVFNVKAKPLTHGLWLPSENLSLSVNYSGLSKNLQVGDLVTRTITLSAKGLPSDMLPTLKSSTISHLNIYPNKPILRDELSNEGITGVLTQKEAFMANITGRFVLPGINIRWFNTKTHKFAVASIQPKTLHFLPVAVNKNPEASAPVKHKSVVSEHIMPPKGNSNPWLWLVVALIVLWIITLLAWWYAKFRAQRQFKTQSSPEVSKLSTDTHNTAKPKTLRSVKQALKVACETGDPVATKEALLQWAALKWQEKQFKSLADLALLVDDALKNAILALERYLYREDEPGWTGTELWQAFSSGKSPKKSKKPKSDDPLNPLYLHD